MDMLNGSNKEKETETDVENSGKWWVSWINTAKEKTSTVFEAVKKDLDELAVAVRNEASSVGASIENSLSLEEDSASVGAVKKSISSFFDQVTKALIPPLEDDEADAVLITHDGTLTLTGFSKHLAELQSLDKTYLELPDSILVENYKRWMEVVEQDQFTQERLARHLMGSEILNDKYLTLVPEKICHMEFWQRYLFKRALLEDALANAKISENRAKLEINTDNSASLKKSIVQTEQPKLSMKTIDEQNHSTEETNTDTLENELLNDEINWENGEIPCNVQLTEEEQIRLLEQYEQEIQERGGSKKKIANERTETNKNMNKDQNVKESQPSRDKTKTNDKKLNQKKIKTTNKKITQENEKDSKNLNNSKSRIQPNRPADPQLEKDRDEISSASDESWEKDFDLNDLGSNQ